MIRKYQIGVVQMDTRDDKAANLKAACEFMTRRRPRAQSSSRSRKS